MSVGQIIGTVVGAVIGFYTGGPIGAIQGASIGYTIGTMVDPPEGPKIKPPDIQDPSLNSSTYGAVKPRIYGRHVITGNRFWLEGNQRQKIYGDSGGGKGGSSAPAQVSPLTYTATFAITLCQRYDRPIAGVRKIWIATDLWYDAGADDLESIMASNEAADKFKVYLGSEDQMPDPRIQADRGVANTPAFRGRAYIVFYDLDLSPWGGTLASAPIKVEVVTDEEFDAELIATVGLDVTVDSVSHSGCTNVFGVGDVTGILVNIDTGEDELHNTIYDVFADKVLDPYSPGANIENPLAVSGVGAEYAFDDNDTAELVVNGERYSSGFITVTNKIIYTGAGLLAEVRGGSPSGSPRDGWILWSDADKDTPIAHVAAPSSAVIKRGMIAITEEEILVCVSSPVGQMNVYNHSMGFLRSVDLSALPVFGGTSQGSLYWDEEENVVWSMDTSSIPSQSRLIGIDGTTFELLYEYELPELGESTTGIEAFKVLNRDLVICFYKITAQPKVSYIRLNVPQTDSRVTLAHIVRSELTLSNLITDEDVDVDDLENDLVRGYKITDVVALRSGIEPLQGIFPFDLIQSGYQIKAVKRGASSYFTIPIDDLDARQFGTEPSPGRLQKIREMDTQVPFRFTVAAPDPTREYDINEQIDQRDVTESVHVERVGVVVPLLPDEAKQAANRLLYMRWLERTDFGPFVLPPTYSALEPADVITIESEEANYDLRLTRINRLSDGRLECNAKLNRSAIYNSVSVSYDTTSGSAIIPLKGPSRYELLDVPTIDETFQNTPGFGAVMSGYTTSWPGGVIYRSVDAGINWDYFQGFNGRCSMGSSRNVLAANSGYLIDRTTTLTVDPIGTTEFVSVTESAMLTGSNIFAYGADGRWEIIRAVNCVSQGDGSFIFSTLVRGDFGTEWATGLHQQYDVVILLSDADGHFIPQLVSSIGVEYIYRGITFGADISSDSNLEFTYQGVNLEPLSPVEVRGTRPANDWTITAIRRSRLSSSWWSNGTEAPVGETSSSFECDIMNGAAVVRTLTGSSLSFTYTQAQQITDFGSVQSSITVKLYQLSGTVGRGYAAQATLTV